MAPNKIPIRHRTATPFSERLQSWNIDPDERRMFERFLVELGLGKVNKGFSVSKNRQALYLDTLRVPLEFMGKPVEELETGDVERFECALSDGSLLSNRGQPYADLTKVDMRRALRIYLRWRLGPDKAEKLAGWLDTRTTRKTPDYLSEEDVQKLFQACASSAHRFLIAVLFDSGARAEEFHNIRLEDIRLPSGDDNFVRITLKEEYSKTAGRTVGLYWKQTADVVRDYVLERTKEGLASAEPVIGKSYAAMRQFLRRLGKRVLGRSIHYHLFRHSSATYYATRLNRQELCYRYGWKFSSNMPDVYISRSGMVSKELDEKFTQTELGTVQSQLARMEEESRIKNETIRKLQDTLKAMQSNMSDINEILAMKPTVDELKAAIERKRSTGN